MSRGARETDRERKSREAVWSWTREPFRGDNRPFLAARHEIDAFERDRGRLLQLASQEENGPGTRSVAGPDYLLRLYRRGYARYLATEHLWLDGGLSLIDTATPRPNPPYPLEFAKLRFLLATQIGDARPLDALGARLERADPGDFRIDSGLFRLARPATPAGQAARARLARTIVRLAPDRADGYKALAETYGDAEYLPHAHAVDALRQMIHWQVECLRHGGFDINFAHNLTVRLERERYCLARRAPGAWTTASWQGDDTPYRAIRLALVNRPGGVDSQVVEESAAEFRATRSRLALFKWGCARVMARDMTAEDEPLDLIRHLEREKPPYTREFTRMRFLVTAGAALPQMEKLGVRLIKSDPSDVDVVFTLVRVTECTSDAGKQRALSYALPLVHLLPNDARSYEAVAECYWRRWSRSQSDEADMREAMRWQQEAVKHATAPNRANLESRISFEREWLAHTRQKAELHPDPATVAGDPALAQTGQIVQEARF